MTTYTSIDDGPTRTIHHGDALEVLSELPDACVDLIFADPPYNIGKQFGDFIDRWPSDKAYAQWCALWLEHCVRILKPHGALYLMSSTQCMPYLDIYLRDHMTILSRIIWSYDSSGAQAKKYFGSLYEPILFAVKSPKNYTFNAQDILVDAPTGSKRQLIDYRKTPPQPYNTQKVPGNVWTFPRVRYRMAEYEAHPTQKPESLLERIILASSNAQEVVLDPFGGSFTTGAVAMRLARQFIGIERQENYLKIGLRRLAIDTHYKGELLKPMEKSYKRQNP